MSGPCLKAPTKNSHTGRHWCGPYAYALLLGLDYEAGYKRLLGHIRRAIIKRRRARRMPERVIRGNLPRFIKGVYTSTLVAALAAAGVKTAFSRKHAGVTVLTFTREHTVRGVAYLLDAGHHFGVILDGVLYDNRGPCPVEECHWKLARVEEWSIVKPRSAALDMEAAAV